MNPDGAGGFDRCAKHPSQHFTGFCSSCLAERLSSVDPVERSPNPGNSEIVEIGTDSSDKDRNHRGEVRVRKTLLSLFQLDDGNGAEGSVDARSDLAKSASVGSSSRSSAAKGLRWRTGSRRGQAEEGCLNCMIGGGGGRHSERKHSLRRSCEWKGGSDCRDDGKDGLEKPRHSWDGSMMGKALTCSFAACLEEPQDGSSRIRRSVPEGPIGSVDTSDKKPKPEPPGEGHREESRRREINVSDVCRKKSQRWSRVWDWSITSPFRDLGKKRQHVLDRSMSESWPEYRGMAEPDNAAHPSVNGSVRTTTLRGSQRSTNGAGSELQKYRPDMQKKREYRFGRSRSVHYPSPRNVDNGLLRFYLTPMRTSRSTNKGRTKTSRFFTKSLLGL
ncbi:uncharacterized protein M6B38_257370 [Iris pallida]|uniref:Uncharacterized protein n=1 Tax=Iris pallida TaxID=29817 RepID=A0AAX6IGR4_IRIPA|nr:uncharacterized protein M6B38_257370 [Iris pallida]